MRTLTEQRVLPDRNAIRRRRNGSVGEGEPRQKAKRCADLFGRRLISRLRAEAQPRGLWEAVLVATEACWRQDSLGQGLGLEVPARVSYERALGAWAGSAGQAGSHSLAEESMGGLWPLWGRDSPPDTHEVQRRSWQRTTHPSAGDTQPQQLTSRSAESSLPLPVSMGIPLK